MNDPIGDFIIRIKNAGRAKKQSVLLPYSSIKNAIAEVLFNRGYVGVVSKKQKGNMSYLNVEILYGEDKKPLITNVKRISKPSRRIYERAKNIRIFRKGYGISVFSTPKGILSDTDAMRENVGGEHLFNIW